MNNIKIKPAVIKMSGDSLTLTRSKIEVRDIVVAIDAPQALGGTNTGPTPPEGMLASLIGCTNVISNKIAEKNGAIIESMTVDLEAKFDRAGALLMEEIQVPFPEVKLKISMKTSASEEVVAIIKRDLMRYCPVAKVMRQSGTNIIEEWSISRP